jgi:hypothetical protein
VKPRDKSKGKDKGKDEEEEKTNEEEDEDGRKTKKAKTRRRRRRRRRKTKIKDASPKEMLPCCRQRNTPKGMCKKKEAKRRKGRGEKEGVRRGDGGGRE